MALGLLGRETAARIAVGVAGLGLPVALFGAWQWVHASQPVTLHARMSEVGGWAPEVLRVEAGRPLELRLISDDVVHGFAIGQSQVSPIDLLPGQVVTTTLTFDAPGSYSYYCTRWCGPNHWRMRGVIEVTGPEVNTAAPSPPLYEVLGIDLDAPHPAAVVPQTRPSAARGAQLGLILPEDLTSRDAYASRSPAETWRALRAMPLTEALTDDQVWDLVAWIWRTQASEAALQQGAELFAQNCAACHGEGGSGDGVMASSVVAGTMGPVEATGPADFTDASRALGASPALLHGKISRGGMGTGMPYWGPILTEEEIWILTDYLWTFQFEE